LLELASKEAKDRPTTHAAKCVEWMLEERNTDVSRFTIELDDEMCTALEDIAKKNYRTRTAQARRFVKKCIRGYEPQSTERLKEIEDLKKKITDSENSRSRLNERYTELLNEASINLAKEVSCALEDEAKRKKEAVDSAVAGACQKQEKLLKLLEKLEWSHVYGSHIGCPVCENSEPEGHVPGCSIGTALKTKGDKQ